MKKVIIILALLAAFTVYLSAVEKIKPFVIEDANGKKISSTELLAKGPIVIDFWATFCGPCMKELPELSKMQDKYKEITVIAISNDSPKTKDKAKAHVKSSKYSFITAFDDAGTVKKMLNITDIPRTVLINKDSEIVFDHTGYIPGDEKHIDEAIEKLLQGK